MSSAPGNRCSWSRGTAAGFPRLPYLGCRGRMPVTGQDLGRPERTAEMPTQHLPLPRAEISPSHWINRDDRHVAPETCSRLLVVESHPGARIAMKASESRPPFPPPPSRTRLRGRILRMVGVWTALGALMGASVGSVSGGL